MVLAQSRRFTMTRNERLAILVADDIINIKNDILVFKDYSYIWAICTGDGFTQYNKMTDEQITSEIQERELDESVLEFAVKIHGILIDKK